MPEEDVQQTELPIESVGTRLRNARNVGGMSRSEVATRTKIAERHLISIEEDRFLDLPGKTYAVGFSRAYARTVGLDEAEIAQAVRDLLAASEEPVERYQPATFEPGDPARVPGSRVAWIAAVAAVAVLVAVYFLWRSFLSPAVSLPDLTQEPQQQAAPASAGKAAPAAPAKPAAAAGPVVFTALEPNVWIKFYDASGEQLMQKQMAEGERYTVPADAEGPQVRTGRPDAFEITIGGKKVPPLSDTPIVVSDVPVSAKALLARTQTAPAPAEVAPTPTPRQTSAPSTRAAPSTRTTPTTRSTPRPTARPSAPASSPRPTASASPRPAPTATPAPAPSPTSTPAAEEPSTVSE
ncbi:MAG: DUF4115 domain-containing protein [Novosphingobium sp.]|nr:DUF4115 domain-containing protein [Novosphingobium sp.]MCP5401464.1 DUF4115 domain-containing protein [Novosphingobium sp.]